MLIQRRPGASTTSTRGWSARGEVSSLSAVARRRRPMRGLGRLGIRTQRLVGGREHHDHHSTSSRQSPPIGALQNGVVLAILYLGRRFTHPEGGREWPFDPPPTPPQRLVRR